jgi:hypothetical protein
MQILKVDVIGSQPFEASVNRRGNVSATTHAGNSFTLLIRVAAELCGQDDLVSPAADRATDESFVVTLASFHEGISSTFWSILVSGKVSKKFVIAL